MNYTNATTNLSINSPTNSGSHTNPGDGQVTAWKIAQMFGYYVMILLSLIGNTVVIKAIKRIGRTVRRQVHYIFIVNLSVADLLLAVENIPITYTHLLLNGAWKVEGRFGNFLCQFDMFLSAIFILSSNLTIVAIALEKFCGIFFPMKKFVSRKRAYLILASTWLVGALYSLPLFFFVNLRKYPDGKLQCFICIHCEKIVQWFVFQTMLLATGFIITLALYSAIGIKIWLRKMPGIHLYEVQRKTQAKKYKALKMLALLVVVFYISFIPFWIYQLSLHFGFHDKLASHHGQIAAFLMFCNGAINPVIYSLYNLEIRSEFKSLFCCLNKRSPTIMQYSFKTSRMRNRNSKMETFSRQSSHKAKREKKKYSASFKARSNEKKLSARLYDDSRL